MLEALAPVGHHSCMASVGDGPTLGVNGGCLGSERAAWDPSPRHIPHGVLLDACSVPVSGSDGGPASISSPVRQGGVSRLVLCEECGTGAWAVLGGLLPIVHVTYQLQGPWPCLPLVPAQKC